MKCGYAWVSTRSSIPIETLEQEGCQKIFEDKFTGTKRDRLEFNKLIDTLKTGDVFIVTQFNRFVEECPLDA